MCSVFHNFELVVDSFMLCEFSEDIRRQGRVTVSQPGGSEERRALPSFSSNSHARKPPRKCQRIHQSCCSTTPTSDKRRIWCGGAVAELSQTVADCCGTTAYGCGLFRDCRGQLRDSCGLLRELGSVADCCGIVASSWGPRLIPIRKHSEQERAKTNTNRKHAHA
jgi:hypothetical protein